jgi:PKD repeat protein
MGIQAWNTQDWINGGIWSRGHMSPSADWADTPGDNAPTFFLSNMIPQNQAANSGAWGSLENYLRTLTTGGTEIYIIAGPIFTKNRSGAGVDGFGFMNSSGRIAVPDSMWKVAVIVPDTRSASEIDSPSDVQVIAVAMPNEASSTGDYTRFTTTIDKIERSTGYDLLSILPANVQCRIEVRNCVPVAHLTGDLAGGSEGETLTFSAGTSSDADADALSYQWTLAGQPAGSAATLTHTFADNGSYAVRVIVSDDKGAADTANATIVVTNVAPRVAAFDGATILAGETYSTTGSFTDPGADTWRGSVNYGDGSATAALAIDGKTFSLEHRYSAAGSYTVAVNVLDKDGGMGSASAQVTVQSPLQGIANLRTMVASLGGRGGLNAGQLNSLQVKIDNASRQLADGEETAATNMLEALLNEIDALGKSGRVSDAAAAPIVDYARRVIASIGG